MNYKYTKKPVQIEAFQMTENRRLDKKDWPKWLLDAINKPVEEIGSLYNCYSSDDLCIATLEGSLTVAHNDFIIQGVKGELYPCKPDIFEMTYDESP